MIARQILSEERARQQGDGNQNSAQQATEPTQPPAQEPAPESTPAPDYGFCEESHRRLVNIFSYYEPQRLPQIVSILLQFRGHEGSVIGACLRKAGGPEPGVPGGPPAPLDLPLEDGWREVRGRRGHLYYRQDDGRKQWARPVVPGAAPQPPAQPIAQLMAQPQLTPGAQPTPQQRPAPVNTSILSQPAPGIQDHSFHHSPTASRDQAPDVQALRAMMQQIPGIPTFENPEPEQPQQTAPPPPPVNASQSQQELHRMLTHKSLNDLGDQILADGLAQSTWVQ